MASDLRAHLDGLPVSARPASFAYRAGKTMRRHRLAVAALALVTGAVVVGAGLALWQAREARTEALRANAVQRFLLDIFATSSARQPDPERARAVTARQLLDIGRSRLDAALSDEPETKAGVTEMLRDLYAELGLTEQSIALGRDAVSLAIRLHGADSEQHLRQLVALAGQLHHHGSMDERRTVLETGLAIVARQPDRPNAGRQRLFNALAEFHQSTNLQRAAEFAERAVSDARVVGTQLQLTVALGNAANIAWKQVDRPRAEALFVEALQIGEAARSAGFDLLPTRVVLAQVQAEQLRHDAAEATLREALATAVRVHGTTHLDTLQTPMRLGAVLSEAGRLRQSEAELQPVVDALDAAPVKDEFTLPQALSALGVTHARMGRPTLAERSLHRAIEIRDRVRPNTSAAAELREQLATALVQDRRLAEAQALLDQAVRIRRLIGMKPGDRPWDHVTRVELDLAVERDDLDARRRLLSSLLAGSVNDRGVSTAWLDAALRYAGFDLDDGRPADAMAKLQTVGDVFARRQLVGKLPLLEGEHAWLCGRAAIALARPAQARAWLERADVALRSQLDPASRRVQQLADVRATLPALQAPPDVDVAAGCV